MEVQILSPRPTICVTWPQRFCAQGVHHGNWKDKDEEDEGEKQKGHTDEESRLKAVYWQGSA